MYVFYLNIRILYTMYCIRIFKYVLLYSNIYCIQMLCIVFGFVLHLNIRIQYKYYSNTVFEYVLYFNIQVYVVCIRIICIVFKYSNIYCYRDRYKTTLLVLYSNMYCIWIFEYELYPIIYLYYIWTTDQSLTQFQLERCGGIQYSNTTIQLHIPYVFTVQYIHICMYACVCTTGNLSYCSMMYVLCTYCVLYYITYLYSWTI